MHQGNAIENARLELCRIDLAGWPHHAFHGRTVLRQQAEPKAVACSLPLQDIRIDHAARLAKRCFQEGRFKPGIAFGQCLCPFEAEFRRFDAQRINA